MLLLLWEHFLSPLPFMLWCFKDFSEIIILISIWYCFTCYFWSCFCYWSYYFINISLCSVLSYGLFIILWVPCRYFYKEEGYEYFKYHWLVRQSHSVDSFSPPQADSPLFPSKSLSCLLFFLTQGSMASPHSHQSFHQWGLQTWGATPLPISHIILCLVPSLSCYSDVRSLWCHVTS